MLAAAILYASSAYFAFAFGTSGIELTCRKVGGGEGVGVSNPRGNGGCISALCRDFFSHLFIDHLTVYRIPGTTQCDAEIGRVCNFLWARIFRAGALAGLVGNPARHPVGSARAADATLA